MDDCHGRAKCDQTYLGIRQLLLAEQDANATLRARIAELEAPVLPETVAREVEWLNTEAANTLYHEPCIRLRSAAALLTRLSTVTEEDVERVARAIFFRGEEQDDVMWERMHDHSRVLAREQARAALTAVLKGK